jgi:hypothetical protein
MKGTPSKISIIILMTAVTLIGRPIIIYSSTVIQSALASETRAYGYLRSARKRKEQYNQQDIIPENETKSWLLPDKSLLSFQLKKWSRLVISMLSILFSSFYFLRRRRSVFEVSPQHKYLFSLSTLRI